MNPKEAMEPYVKQVNVLLSNKTVVNGRFLLWDNAPEDPQSVKVSLQFLDKELSRVAANYYSALLDIRRELELSGILIGCYGASRNVWPSAMSASMGGGGKAFKCFYGKESEPQHLVSIFDSGQDLDVCLLKDQEEFHKQWLLSVGITPGKKYVPWLRLFGLHPIKTLKLFFQEKLRRK